MSLASELYKIRCAVLKPAPKLSLVDWAEKYRHLSKISSAEPGLWRTSRVEVARGPMLAVTDPSVNMITIVASTQTMKALDVDTPIATTSGWKTMATVNVGDKIFDDKGNQCTVTGKSEIKRNPTVKVEFSDESVVICDLGHRWQVDDYKSGNPVKRVMTTEQIYQSCLYLGGSPCRFGIDVVGTIDCQGYQYDKPDFSQRTIVSIEPYGERDVQCLAVDSPSHLYLCTKNFIPTHNTEILNNIAGFYIHQDPSPIIMVQPTKEMAEAWSKERLTPMLEASPALKNIMGNKHVESGNKILTKVFDGGNIAMVGANAPAGLAMRPVRIVLCDEIDKYPQSAGKEGDPIKLVTERAATFWNRLVVLVCSPTIEGQSRIAESYDQSDKRKFFTPCPHCGHEQVMEWERVKWPEDEPDKALYHCFDCDKPWQEAERLRAIQKSFWKATAPFKGHAGFHCSKLVSPWEDMAVLANKFVDAKGKREQMKTFVNTQLARTFKEDTDVPDWHRLYERREHYAKNVVPRAACYLTMGVDVQGNRLELEIKAYGPVKNSWSLDYRIIEGSPSEAETWDKLEAVINEDFKIEGARHTRKIDMTAIDSGYCTQDVYYFTSRFSSNKVMVIKGFDHMDSPISSPKPVSVRRDGKKLKRGQLLWPVGSTHLKAEAYGWLKKNAPVEGEPDPYGYCHFPEYSEEFFKMLTAEEVASKIVNGYTKRQWIKVRDRNEALDLAVYNRAAVSALGIDRLKEAKLIAIAEKRNGKPQDTIDIPVEELSLPAPTRKKVAIKRRKSSWL